MRYAHSLMTEGRVPPALRELVILRVAWLMGSDYVWGGHRLIADDVRLHIPVDGCRSWSREDVVAVELVDELLRTGTITRITRDRIEALWDGDVIVELVLLIGQYHTLCRLADVRHFGVEPGCPARPPDWPGPDPAATTVEMTREEEAWGVSGTNRKVVGIAGTGFIGASIGLALRSADYRTVGFDARSEASAVALQRGAIERVVSSVEELASVADVVVVAVDPGSTVDVSAKALRAGARVVTDVASVKEPVVSVLGTSPRFVGGHPMAGSEKSGPGAARADLFAGAMWLLSPTAETDPTAIEEVVVLALAVGAKVMTVEADEHDRLVAVASHLPHLVAAMLVASAAHDPEAHLLAEVLATGWLSTTRVASGNPEMWIDIVAANARSLVSTTRRFAELLLSNCDLLAAGDTAPLLELLHCAASFRDGIVATASPTAELADLRVVGGTAARPLRGAAESPCCTCGRARAS